MPWAIAAAAVVGAVSSDRASGKAARATGRAADAAFVETRRAADEARRDINTIYPEAQRTAQQGFQGALDVFGQSLPAQTSTFQSGNIGAQQAILAGLPQIQNALFGNQVDYSQMQPFEVQQPDLGFFNQTLPQIAQRQQLEQKQALELAMQQQSPTNTPYDDPRNNTSLAGGYFGGRGR